MPHQALRLAAVISMADRPAVPDGYPQLLAELKREVRAAQYRARVSVNTEALILYWRIGQAILERQGHEGWGAKVIDHLAADLRAEFPDMTGWSHRNLLYMRAFAAAWPDLPNVPQPVAQLPWGHVRTLLDTLDDQAARDWYANRCSADGWSRAVLADRIKGRLHLREGLAPSNFDTALAGPDSELAQQLAKDPYSFDFLGLNQRVAERDLEAGLVQQIERFLLELGTGFAFVARQFRFEVDGDEFAIDLLFFHYVQNRFVVVELKIEKFKPEHTGQLGMYVSWVDGNLRGDAHGPTIGILICAAKNDRVVRYALGGIGSPLAVSTFTYDLLPSEVRASVPSADALANVTDGRIVG